MIEKLKDKLLDGRWEFHHIENTLYVFKNIYNGKEISLSMKQVKNILNGKDTISHIQCRRLGKDKRDNSPNWWGNNIVRNFAKQLHKHSK